MTTNTQKIFTDLCPFKNSSQTQATRLLFVCSVGMLRSPTAQVAASTLGYNARAAGSAVDIALIPMSVNLINWANKIIFMNLENRDEALMHFLSVGYDKDIINKQIIWNIDDHYNWGDNVLYSIILDKLKTLKNKGLYATNISFSKEPPDTSIEA